MIRYALHKAQSDSRLVPLRFRSPKVTHNASVRGKRESRIPGKEDLFSFQVASGAPPKD